MSISSFQNKFSLRRFSSALVLFSIAFSFLAPLAHAQTEPPKTRELIADEKPSIKNEKRLALVIGNSKYQYVTPLKNAANDAMDLTNTLKELGFEVISGINQNEEEMHKLIRSFGDKLMIQKGVGLFFFAGHGVQSRNRNYLVPVDAEILREDEIEFQAIDINAVMAKMETAKTDLNIIMLDACRNNPFAKEWSKFRAMGEQDGLAKIDAPRNTVMFYAAEPGKVALDGTGKNGTFTEALLEHIKKPDVELDIMFKQVRRSVLEKSNQKQAAYVEGTNFNDFYFAKAENKPNPNSPGTVTKSSETDSTSTEKNAVTREQEAWDYAKNNSDEDILRLFLSEFPNGANAAKAKIKLEQIVWDSIKTTSDLDAVERFLKEFPNNVVARMKLQQLKKKEKASAENTAATNSTKENVTAEIKPEDNKPIESKIAENKPQEIKPSASKTSEIVNKEEGKTAVTETVAKPIENPAGSRVAEKTRFSLELEAWNAVKTSAGSQQIRAFLAEFPDGGNAERAKIRLEQVRWDEIRVTKDKALLSEHLKEFPNGANAPLARLALRQLETPENQTSDSEMPVTTTRTAGAGGAKRINPAESKIPARTNAAGMEFVFIPAGNFTMGATAANAAQTLTAARKDYADFDQTQLNNEKPARRVTIAQGFWMGRFEVTQAQWAAVMGENPSWFKGCDNCPVERVSWEMAKDFVRRLNELNDGYLYRLPTEAEWEYSARANTTGIFSGPIEQMSWHNGNSEDKTHPVGEKLPNPFGLYDIYGNVLEWCEDLYSSTYEGLPVDGSANTSVGNPKFRVLRGGSWNNQPTNSRSTRREQYLANAFGMHIGLRVVAVKRQ